MSRANQSGVFLQSAYRTHYIRELNKGMSGREVVLAGWVHEVRNIGKIIFLLLRDHSGIVQVTAKQGAASEELMKKMNLPKESVVMVKGVIKENHESKKGFEVAPTEITDLNPLSAGIPFEVTGKVPAEIDVRLDNRSIDLRRLESTAVFNIESTVLGSFKNICTRSGFQEIKTASLVEAATEGGTDLFEVQYFEKKAYLSQSPQLYKQLAVIGGMDRVFMITPVFRAEKHNTIFHLNESTQMDIEMGFADHNDAIKMLKKVSTGIIGEVIKRNKTDLETLGVELKKPRAKVLTYKNALKKLNANGLEISFGEDLVREHEEALCKMFGDLVLIKEYPTEIRAFYSMPNSKHPEISNSYDLIYKGLEICSGAQRIHIADMLVESLKKRNLNPDNFEFYGNPLVWEHLT